MKKKLEKNNKGNKEKKNTVLISGIQQNDSVIFVYYLHIRVCVCVCVCVCVSVYMCVCVCIC